MQKNNIEKNAGYISAGLALYGLDEYKKRCYERNVNPEANETINMLDPYDSSSMLEEAIGSCHYDAIKFFMARNVRVNVVTKGGYNELHLVAENCMHDDVEKKNTYNVELFNTLIDRGVSLKQQDKAFLNLPVYSLIYAHGFKYEGGEELIKRCVRLYPEPHIKTRSGADLYSWMGDLCPWMLPDIKAIIAEAKGVAVD